MEALPERLWQELRELRLLKGAWWPPPHETVGKLYSMRSAVNSSGCRGQPQPHDGQCGVEAVPARLRQELRELRLL